MINEIIRKTRAKINLLILCILLISSLSACSSSSVNKSSKLSSDAIKLPINYQLFNVESELVIDESELFELSKEQQLEFMLYFNQSISTGNKPHEALSQFIYHRLSNFTYYGETYTAEKAMRLNKGNCMSLAIMTTAFAQLVDLEYAYREVNTIPIFEQQNNLLLSSSHVQTVIYDPEFSPTSNHFYLIRPSIIIDYFPSKSNVSGKRFKLKPFLAM